MRLQAPNFHEFGYFAAVAEDFGIAEVGFERLRLVFVRGDLGLDVGDSSPLWFAAKPFFDGGTTGHFSSESKRLRSDGKAVTSPRSPNPLRLFEDS